MSVSFYLFLSLRTFNIDGLCAFQCSLMSLYLFESDTWEF